MPKVGPIDGWRSASSSMASSETLAAPLPYASSSSGLMPIRAAMSTNGRSFAWRAMARSVGNVMSGDLSLESCCRPCVAGQKLLTPSLRVADAVEGEQVPAGDLHVRIGYHGCEAVDELVGTIAAGQLGGGAGLLAQERERVA